MLKLPKYNLIDSDPVFNTRTYSSLNTRLKITKDHMQYGTWVDTDVVSDNFMLGYLLGSLSESDYGYPLEYTVVRKKSRCTCDGSGFTAIKGWFKKEKQDGK